PTTNQPSPTPPKTQIDRECLDKEPKILHILSPHPNILQIHNIFDSDSHLLIVTDLCKESTLYDLIVSGTPFSEPEACSALAHCHRNFICHRNRVKLCDFGSAEWYGGVLEGRERMSGIVGTPYYVAPEVLAGREYIEKIDVWIAGVILYIMQTREEEREEGEDGNEREVVGVKEPE
ncbi:Phosphoenolpyruvate carboxylase kinase 1, partial [Bienertia sinuspersici]